MIRALPVLLIGCTFSAGEGFARLDGGTLSVALEPGPARDLGDGAVLTDLGHEVHLDTLQLTVSDVRLVALAGSADFDPADPPPGYGNCHDGHCHADDGSLVSYAEIEAELAGGGFTEVAWFTVGGDLDGQADAVDLGPALPQADLPLVSLSRVLLGIDRLVVDGVFVADGVETDLAVDLPVSLELGVDLPFTVDRAAPAHLWAEVGLTLDATLLDGADPPAEPIDDSTDAGADALVSWLSLSPLDATLEKAP